MSATPAPASVRPIGVLLSVAALGVVLAAVSDRAFELDRFFAPKELLLHATAVVAGGLTLRARARRSFGRGEALLAAWLVASLLSGLLATNGWVAARAIAITASALLVFGAAREVAEGGGARALLAGLAAATVAGSLTALAQAYGVESTLLSMSRAPGGTFGNRNFMAHVAAIGVPLLVGLTLTARGWLGALGAAAGLLLHAAAIVLSRTRAAWLALALWGVLALVALLGAGPLWRRPGFVPRLALLGAMLVAGVAGALLLPNALDWKSDAPYLESARGMVNYRDGSGAGRLRQWVTSTRMAARDPLLGVGPGNWPVVYPSVAPAGDPSLLRGSRQTANPWPSSDWVAALSERGVLGFAALALAVLALAWCGWRLWWDRAQDAEVRILSLAGWGVLTVCALEGAFDAVLLLAPPTLLVMGIAGAAIAPRDAAVPALSRGVVVAVLSAALAASTVGIAGSAGRIAAMGLSATGGTAALERAAQLDPGNVRVRLRLAERYASAGRCPAALEQAEAARRLFPAPGLSRQALGGCVRAVQPGRRARG